MMDELRQLAAIVCAMFAVVRLAWWDKWVRYDTARLDALFGQSADHRSIAEWYGVIASAVFAAGAVAGMML